MTQGGWDVGTWDDALWDSLPITGNSATGSPGSVGVGARTVALTGVTGTGQAGTVAPSDTTATTGNTATGAVGTAVAATTVALTGVSATGQIGTEGEAVTVSLTGTSATGEVGTVSRGETSIALDGVQATGAVGTVTFVPAPIVIVDDTHDGDYIKRRKKLFDEEIQRVARRREDIIAAYERIVEGKPEIAKELVADFEIKPKKSKNKEAVLRPNIDFDKFTKDLARVERLWNLYLEIEDEDLLVLL